VKRRPGRGRGGDVNSADKYRRTGEGIDKGGEGGFPRV
jgi:hypothetical protein